MKKEKTSELTRILLVCVCAINLSVNAEYAYIDGATRYITGRSISIGAGETKTVSNLMCSWYQLGATWSPDLEAVVYKISLPSTSVGVSASINFDNTTGTVEWEWYTRDAEYYGFNSSADSGSLPVLGGAWYSMGNRYYGANTLLPTVCLVVKWRPAASDIRYNTVFQRTFSLKFTTVSSTPSTPTAPGNDSFSSPVTITGSSGSKTGNNVGATMQTSEPKPSAQSSSTRSVWYKWTAPSSGTFTFDTIGSSLDTVLAVYTGTSVSSLSEVASDDDSGANSTSKLSFQAVSGTTYRIAVYAYGENAGDFKLNWSQVATAPTAPTVKVATWGAYANTSYIEIDWEPVSGATSYDIYRSTSNSRPSTPLATNVSSPYYDYKSSGLIPGTQYFYWVSAKNSGGTSYSDSDWGIVKAGFSGVGVYTPTSLGWTQPAIITSTTNQDDYVNRPVIDEWQPFNIRFCYRNFNSNAEDGAQIEILLEDENGTTIFSKKMNSYDFVAIPAGDYRVWDVFYDIPAFSGESHLKPGQYTVKCWACSSDVEYHESNNENIFYEFTFEVAPKLPYLDSFGIDGQDFVACSSSVDYRLAWDIDSSNFDGDPLLRASLLSVFYDQFAEDLIWSIVSSNEYVSICGVINSVKSQLAVKDTPPPPHDQDVTIEANFVLFGSGDWSEGPVYTNLTARKNVTILGLDSYVNGLAIRNGVLYDVYPKNIVDVTIPSNITSIGGYAFSGCTNLLNVTIPNGVTSIGGYAFKGCSSLESVTIPGSVTNIGRAAFATCSRLAKVFFEEDAPSIGSWCFNGNTSIYVKENSTGWNVPIPGTWNGLSIEYYDPSEPMGVVAPVIGVDGIVVDGDSVVVTHDCTVTIACATEGATVYYSTDGSTPRPSNRFKYTGPFTIADTAEICAYAVLGDESSEFVTVTVTKVEPIVLTLADAVDCSANTVTTGGDADWTPVEDATAVGGSSARCGAVSPEESTWMEMSVSGAGTLTFSWRSDCEKDPRNRYSYDLGAFTVDGTVTNRIDGTTAWQTVTVEIAESGTHTFRWTYIKDDYDEDDFEGEDCIWVDNVIWTPSAQPVQIPNVTTDDKVDGTIDSVGFADAVAVKKAIGGSAAEYGRFKSWAGSVKDVNGAAIAGEAVVVGNTNAAAAYLLGADRLFANQPKVELGNLAVGDEGVKGELTLSVTVKDGEDVVKCAAEKVKNLFEATSSLGDWQGEKVKLVPNVEILSGSGDTMHFKVTPGDGTAPSAFLRIRK